MSDPVFSEAQGDFDPSKLNPEQQIALRAAQKAHDLAMEPGVLDPKDLAAKYKIEVQFYRERSLHSYTPSMIQVWESGKRLHGGGDDLMHMCLDNREGHDDGCKNWISSEFIHAGIAHCPHCQMMINASLLTAQLGQNMTNKQLGEKVARIFRQLNNNCDIYVKYSPKDIRYQACEKKFGWTKARELKGLLIYPLSRILQDTAAGSSLESRFRALFDA